MNLYEAFNLTDQMWETDEEFKLNEDLGEEVLVNTGTESPIENNVPNNVAINTKPLPKQIEALINEYNERVTRQIRQNYAEFDRMATKLPPVVDITAEYDEEAGCYDIVFHFSRKIYEPEVATIFHVMFVANRFHRYGKFSQAYKELLNNCFLDGNRISFWHRRLQNMGIRTGLRDKTIK